MVYFYLYAMQYVDSTYFLVASKRQMISFSIENCDVQPVNHSIFPEQCCLYARPSEFQKEM